MSLVLAVIPVRYASARFPGKALAPLGDRTLLEEVWRRASAAETFDRLIVAADDRRVLDAAARFGAEVLQTSAEHPSGTDRVAEVVQAVDEPYDLVVNVQVDEPLLTPTSLDRLVSMFERPDPPPMATLVEPIDSIDEVFDPNIVKVVTSLDGRALYFSRSAIPYQRGPQSRLEADFRRSIAARDGRISGFLKHPGVYAYRRAVLLELSRIEPSPLERAEGLEQLRALQAGIPVHVLDSGFKSISVDTPADLERVAKVLTEAHEC